MKNISSLLLATVFMAMPAWPQEPHDQPEASADGVAAGENNAIAEETVSAPSSAEPEAAILETASLGADGLPPTSEPSASEDEAPVMMEEFTFSAIGDIPYTSLDLSIFKQHLADHNRFSPSDFLVHVGDIKSGASPCVESAYVKFATMLKELKVPTFVLPGDNEWNDCANVDQAWSFWQKHLGSFEKNFCELSPSFENQEVRPENFAWVHKGVLAIGLNNTGGRIHDPEEWSTRLQQNADWIQEQFERHGAEVRAAVVLGHAGPHESRRRFFDQLTSESAAFGKPVIYLHGDGHVWRDDRHFTQAPNIRRIQIHRNDPPLHITVTLDPEKPFVVEREPWTDDTPPLHRRPCGDPWSPRGEAEIKDFGPVFSDDFESGTASAWGISFP